MYVMKLHFNKHIVFFNSFNDFKCTDKCRGDNACISRSYFNKRIGFCIVDTNNPFNDLKKLLVVFLRTSGTALWRTGTSELARWAQSFLDTKKSRRSDGRASRRFVGSAYLALVGT